MKSGRRPGNTFIPKQFTDYYESPKKSSRLITNMLAKVTEATNEELSELTGLARSTVKNLTREMRHYKFIYVSGWRDTVGKGRAPVYSIGNTADAPRNNKKSKSVAIYAKVKSHAVKQQTAEQLLAERCIQIAALLIPTRTEEQRREVNRQYLNHISGGVYG